MNTLSYANCRNYIITISLFSLVCICFIFELFADEGSNVKSRFKAEENISQVVNVPSSVKIETSVNGECLVTINGVGTEGLKRVNHPNSNNSMNQLPLDYIAKNTTEFNLDIDYKNSTCKISTKKEISKSVLVKVVNELSRVRNDIPCWDELNARDLTLSSNFDKNTYKIEKSDNRFHKNLAWFLIPKGESFSSPFMVSIRNKSERGRIIVSPVPGQLFGNTQYAIRIINSAEQVIWSNTSICSGIVEIALCDLNSDGLHEFCLSSSSDLIETFYVSPVWLHERKMNIPSQNQ